MKQKTQHAKLQAARAALKEELQYTNDQKIKYKSRAHSFYIDAEPTTRAGRAAFANLNDAKDSYREVVKTEEVLQTLLGLTKTANQVESAQDRTDAIKLAEAKRKGELAIVERSAADARAIARDAAMFARLTHEREMREANVRAIAYQRKRVVDLSIREQAYDELVAERVVAKANADFDRAVAQRALKTAQARSRNTKTTSTDITQIWDVLAGDIFGNQEIVRKIVADRVKQTPEQFFVDPYAYVDTKAITVRELQAQFLGLGAYKVGHYKNGWTPVEMPKFTLRGDERRDNKIVFKFKGD